MTRGERAFLWTFAVVFLAVMYAHLGSVPTPRADTAPATKFDSWVSDPAARTTP